MEIIPYPSNQEIVLRHKDSVVVFDPASKQLVVRNAPSPDKLDLLECPYCHKPLRDDGVQAEAVPSPNMTSSFASPDYFRMLHHSLPGSADSSRPPSPRRRLTQPVQNSGTPTRQPSVSGLDGMAPARSSSGISEAAFSQGYLSRFFIEERELGRGGKGVVFLVKHILDGVSLGYYALKRIPVGSSHAWLQKVLVEVQLLQHLSHQNLVSYRHVWLEDVKLSNFGPSVPCAFVLQQYCNAGDLHNFIYGNVRTTTTTEQLKDRIRRRSKNEPEPPRDLHGGPRKLQFEEIYSFFRDITSGLNHLHVNNYIHRDLKPSNCLLHDTGTGIRCLVSDFGEVQAENTVRQSTGATGTISYCAPEVLRNDPLTGHLGNFTTKSDVFSLGMILYFLCFAKLPYLNADNLNEENEDIDRLRAEITSWAGLDDQRNMRLDLPDKLYKFLRRLLSLNPMDRPSTEEILHGIKTGAGLDGPFERRPRSTVHSFEEGRTNARRPSVDTIPSSSSMQRPSSSGRSAAPTQLRLASLPTEGNNSTVILQNGQEEMMTPGGSLVLHSRQTSPIKIFDSPPLILPPKSTFIGSPHALHTLKIALLLLKFFSIGLLCNPMAARPAATFAILGVAAMDMLLNDSIYISLGLACLHVGMLFGIFRADVLCIPQAKNWDSI